MTVPPGESTRSTTAFTSGSRRTWSICRLANPSLCMIGPSIVMIATLSIAVSECDT